MMKKIFVLVVSLLILKLVNTQTTASHTITLNLSNAIDLAFTQGGAGVNMSFNNITANQNGITAANAAGLMVRSNRGYNISVKTSSASFTSNSATPMPVSNILFVKEASQSGFLSLSATDQNLLAGQAQGSKTFSLSYKATPGFNYDAGDYTVTVIYTATQQ